MELGEIYIRYTNYYVIWRLIKIILYIFFGLYIFNLLLLSSILFLLIISCYLFRSR